MSKRAKIGVVLLAVVLGGLPLACKPVTGKAAGGDGGTPSGQGNTLQEAAKSKEAAEAMGFLQKNQPEEAFRVLDKWIEGKPDDPGRWGVKFFFAAESGHADVALKAADKLTQLCPNDGSWWVGKGQMLAGLKRYEEALEAFDKATVVAPKHEAAWNDRGDVLVRLGKYDEAIKSCDKALELVPGAGSIWFNRAMAYAMKGSQAEALADLKKAIELQGDLKSEALKEPSFKSLYDNADFKKLTQ